MFLSNCASFLEGKMYLCSKINAFDMINDSLPKGVKLIQLPQHVDTRGRLTFLEGNVHLPFAVERVFWITDVPSDVMRGGHAHWTCHEVVFAAKGSFEIEVDDGELCRTLTIDNPKTGILIPAGVWCELRHFAAGTVCVVMASTAYDATGYAHDRASWKEEKLKRDSVSR